MGTAEVAGSEFVGTAEVDDAGGLVGAEVSTADEVEAGVVLDGAADEVSAGVVSVSVSTGVDSVVPEVSGS